ncbi:short-chain dehydrogenase [Aliidiomarina minuta]|uniref:Short-chain dehydrogenase n=1 Tax=Aliidiomarina minuta TaxID=880057 RepID=A0A432WAL2_9GAMM|nr:SDR family oxidoreductase [Aliidiomarina minuta]RUO27081.1 short-chain dehydrogenase [Aliidiomarina minuta]
MNKHRYKKLSEQVVVITGASSGIGLCTAKKAVEQGAKVVLAARNEDALKEICDELNEEGTNAVYVAADVGDEEDVQAIADKAIETFGGFDTWINNAGVVVYSELEDLPMKDHQRIFQTNYWGVVYGSQAAQNHFKQRDGGGVIINVGSINSQMPVPILGAYSASKAAVKAYSDVMRMELSHEKAPVAVTVVMPSGISTPISAHGKTHTGDEGKVMPPLYDPNLVADAILTAAQKKVRDVTIGEAGKANVMAWAAFPSAMGKFLGFALPKAQSTGDPPTEGDNLHTPDKDGDIYLGGERHGIPVSPYTKARLHPGITFGLGVAVATGIVVCAAKKRNLFKREKRHWTKRFK